MDRKSSLKRRIEELEDKATRVEEEAYTWTKTNTSRIKDVRDRLEALANYLGVEFVEVVPADNPIKVQPKEEKGDE